VVSSAVVFEARGPQPPPPELALPPALGAEASARLVPVEVAVDGSQIDLDCASVDLFDCVRDFCYGHSIQPELHCMTSLISTFRAQVL